MRVTDVCTTYGHCYCLTPSPGGRPHQECCLCGHRRLAPQLSSLPGVRDLEDLLRQGTLVDRTVPLTGARHG